MINCVAYKNNGHYLLKFKFFRLSKITKKKKNTKQQFEMSSFFDRKIRTLYSRFDVDGSGSIDVADFTLWGERLVAYGLI